MLSAWDAPTITALSAAIIAVIGVIVSGAVQIINAIHNARAQGQMQAQADANTRSVSELRGTADAHDSAITTIALNTPPPDAKK